MTFTGYYQRPTLCGETLVFMFEDDLWLRDLSSSSSHAYRLTANPGRSSDPQLSPDGLHLAFTSLDEGNPEVYATRLDEMEPQRLTYLGEDTRCVGWSRDGANIIFTSNAGAPFSRIFQLAQVSKDGGPSLGLNLGPAAHISFSRRKGQVIGRHTWDPARWKRYRGGTAGQLWVDREESGDFEPLLALDGNLTRPLWVGNRIYFGSDHEGICNIYSCTPHGEDLKRHTDHDDFYIRYPNSDGQRLVYQCGGDIFLLDPKRKKPMKVDITVHTPRPRLSRKFVAPGRFLESYALSPNGANVVVGVRGKPFTFPHWEDAVEQLGERDGVRHRVVRWTPQGVICVSDASGEEEIGVFADAQNQEFVSLTAGHDIGRVLDIGLSPCGEKLWFTNHRHELYALFFPKPEPPAPEGTDGASAQSADPKRKSKKAAKAIAAAKEKSGAITAPLKPKKKKGKKSKKNRRGSDSSSSDGPEVEKLPLTLVKVAEDKFTRIGSASWSPDGLWLAYAESVNRQDSQIMIWSWETRIATPVTTVPFRDWSPDFDPEGRYLYFLSCRDFDPVRDNVFFEYAFPKAARPYVITLQKEQPDPFLDRPRPPGEEAGPLPSPYLEDEKKDDQATSKSEISASEKNGKDETVKAETPAENGASPDKDKKAEKELKKIRIDFDGIQRRVRVFPIDEGRYFGVMGVRGKAIIGMSSVRPTLGIATTDGETPNGALGVYDFKKLEYTVPIRGVSGFDVSLDRSTVIYRSSLSLRVLKAATIASAPSDRAPGRVSGWLDLSRLKVSVKPLPEWDQMFKEAWRLMRDHFWDAGMSQIDWAEVLKRYQPLLKRLSTRREFSDLLWEFQGELGTSHAYEYGGDYNSGPNYAQGKLASTLQWEEQDKAYRILEIADGDPWSEKTTSPLRLLHNPLQPGDLVLAVNGHRLSLAEPPEKFLVNRADQRVTLTVLRRDSHSGPGEAKEEKVIVKALRREAPIRYRAWVEANRARVHDLSKGRLGYVHIPNMSAAGFAEFHRGYYSEVERDGLVVDVRYNGGGNVSALLLEKLARRRLGFDVQRWGQPIPYPQDSPAGPLVALTNEQAGSDGDIFSHCFKLMGLGPLLGKRTWGGTIGIWPRHHLVDGTVTTQPEFAFWFVDVGWGVENYGTDPDEEIEIRPQDWRDGIDPQLERAVAVGLKLLKKKPPLSPQALDDRPDRRRR
jgi:tricorn protease